MQVDQTTLDDLSMFHQLEEQSILHVLDRTNTTYGRRWLEQLLKHPHDNLKAILQTQETIGHMMEQLDQWPSNITNGTLMVIERFYESQIDRLPDQAGVLGAFSYKLFHTPDYALTRYSAGHAIDFLQGMQRMEQLLQQEGGSTLLQTMAARIKQYLSHEAIRPMLEVSAPRSLSLVQAVRFGHDLLYRLRQNLLELMELYGRMDAYYSMAVATRELGLVFPSFEQSDKPFVSAEGLFHIMLRRPVAYNLLLDHETNFIFLTGANMAGKSTFIKATGIAVYLAHCGMAVPAKNMQLTLFDGILSNINVQDNVLKGESYFFNEVQRIKKTILTVNDGRKWLVLIDELFKGTNIEDAMRCSTEVIQGLLKMKHALFILSTHLYEIADAIKPYPHVAFRYFQTAVEDGQLSFSYQMLDGVSNDRLGYLILQREGVVDLLRNL